MEKASARERQIMVLAQKINQLMRSHGEAQERRNEAIDAYDVARILFRSPENDDGSEGRL
jgi:flagellar biosynthesis regulator FlaF